MLHPGQHILDTLGGDHGEMTAQSLEAWYQQYVAKRQEMGVNVMFKDLTSTATWFSVFFCNDWVCEITVVFFATLVRPTKYPDEWIRRFEMGRSLKSLNGVT